jgi:hypothetical protein
MHVAVTTPAETIDSVRSYSSIVSSFARKRSGSASALSVSGLAQRSLTLQPTCSPSRLNGPLHRRLRQLCHLHRRFDCYRVERTSSRVGLSPTEKHRLSRRTRLSGLISAISVCAPAIEKAISNDPIANHFDLRSSTSYSIRACRYVLCVTRGGCSGSFLGIESGSNPAEAPAQGRVAATEP